MISRSFLKSSIVFTLGGALPMVAGIILLPFYTNLLSDIHYTQLIFYIGISLLFQILFSFSLESYFGVQFTRLSGDEEKQKKFTGTVSILLLGIGVVLLLISCLFGQKLFGIIFDKDLDINFWPYGFYSILTAFFNSYFKASSICLIYLKKSTTFLLVNFINFFVTLIISIGGLYIFPNTIIGPMYGRLLSGLIIFILAQSIFIKNGRFVFEQEFLAELIKFCAPYMIFVISGWVLGQIDRYFLQTGITKADLNAYDLLLKCFFGIEFLQNSLSAVIFPKLYELWGKNESRETSPESNRYFNVFTAVNILQLILFCICIPFVYMLVIKNESFYKSESYIGILAAGYALRSILNFYLSTILFTKKINVLLKIFGLSALFQIGATFIFIDLFGLNGAIYAGLSTKILQVAFCILFTKSVFTYTFNYAKIMLVPFIYVLVNVLQFVFFTEYNLYLYLFQLAFFSALFFVIFKNEIMKVLRDFKVINA